jgi:hypothetical protein
MCGGNDEKMATLTLKLCVALHQGSKTQDVAPG